MMKEKRKQKLEASRNARCAHSSLLLAKTRDNRPNLGARPNKGGKMRRHIACLALVGLSLALAAPALGADPQPTSSYLIQLNGAGPADLSGQGAAARGTVAWVRPEIGDA